MSETAVPHSAAELLTIVVTGNGQDAYDAIQAMIATHGEFLTGLMMRSVLNALRDESEYPPSGCRWCGLDRRLHFQRWADEAGWHQWEHPATGQIKTRMLERRMRKEDN